MTVTIQFVRYTSDRQPVVVDGESYPLDEIELAKAKAQSALESAECDPRVEAARIVDRFGAELYSFSKAAEDADRR